MKKKYFVNKILLKFVQHKYEREKNTHSNSYCIRIQKNLERKIHRKNQIIILLEDVPLADLILSSCWNDNPVNPYLCPPPNIIPLLFILFGLVIILLNSVKVLTCELFICDYCVAIVSILVFYLFYTSSTSYKDILF